MYRVLKDVQNGVPENEIQSKIDNNEYGWEGFTDEEKDELRPYEIEFDYIQPREDDLNQDLESDHEEPNEDDIEL